MNDEALMADAERPQTHNDPERAANAAGAGEDDPDKPYQTSPRVGGTADDAQQSRRDYTGADV